MRYLGNMLNPGSVQAVAYVGPHRPVAQVRLFRSQRSAGDPSVTPASMRLAGGAG